MNIFSTESKLFIINNLEDINSNTKKEMTEAFYNDVEPSKVIEHISNKHESNFYYAFLLNRDSYIEWILNNKKLTHYLKNIKNTPNFNSKDEKLSEILELCSAFILIEIFCLTCDEYFAEAIKNKLYALLDSLNNTNEYADNTLKFFIFILNLVKNDSGIEFNEDFISECLNNIKLFLIIEDIFKTLKV